MRAWGGQGGRVWFFRKRGKAESKEGLKTGVLVFARQVEGSREREAMAGNEKGARWGNRVESRAQRKERLL